jgi:hypothetical protein
MQPDNDQWQGRRPDQVTYSEWVAIGCVWLALMCALWAIVA